LAKRDGATGDKAAIRDTPIDTPLSDGVAPPELSDDWQLEQELRAVERMMSTLEIPASSPRQEQVHTFHPPHNHQPSQAVPIPRRSVTSAPAPKRFTFLSWTMLALGVMAFVFGAVLLVWSFATGRTELWQLGLPVALGGQVGLLLGLILQLEGLWKSSKQTTESLDQLDDQLDELRRTTAMLNTTHSSASQSFYVHMAEGASPQMLLHDLKGQLDMLAMRMGETHAK
jgi:uncharacterized membrane-anchored protein YhcB (DUF1043 family)